MRRIKEKRAYYASLMSNSVSASRLTSPTKTPSQASRSPPVSPVNIMRFGCPADTIVHIPLDIARLKLCAQRNLSMGQCTLQDLLAPNQPPLKLIELKDKDKVIKELTSLKVPMQSFKEVAPGRHVFSLGAHEEIDQEDLRNSILRRLEGGGSRMRKVSVEPCLFPREELDDAEAALSPYRLNEVKPYQTRQSRAFLNAVKSQNHKEVRRLLTISKLLAREQDSLGLTGLHWAVKRDDQRMAELLLTWGVNVNAADMLNRTALYLAVKGSRAKMAAFLIEKGADVTIASVGGSSPEQLMKDGSSLWSVAKRS